MLSKVCDAADWFDPAFLRIIREELEELPRFHRKQWEFAIILRALETHGLLDGRTTGLSMGGGKERLLYSVARRVRRLVVTDLYERDGTWEDARADDPDRHIRSGMPFPVEDARLAALRMDMRNLEFDDESFDFCYSSCAIEHIGERDDFLRHLREAWRVLRPGGLYVLTTEFHYGADVIAHPGNFLFSAEYLEDLVADSPFVPEPVFDARLSPHSANYPFPPNVADLAFREGAYLSSRLLQEFSHVQLLCGKEPFGSACLVLRRAVRPAGRPALRFEGLEKTRAFMAAGVASYRALLERSTVALHAFAFLPGRRSSYCMAGGGSLASVPAGDETVFHTDYVWLGTGPRVFRVAWSSAETSAEGGTIELRIHAHRTLAPQETRCLAAEKRSVRSGELGSFEVRLDADDEDRYAVVGKLVSGRCLLESLSVESAPASRSA